MSHLHAVGPSAEADELIVSVRPVTLWEAVCGLCPWRATPQPSMDGALAEFDVHHQSDHSEERP